MSAIRISVHGVEVRMDRAGLVRAIITRTPRAARKVANKLRRNQSLLIAEYEAFDEYGE